MSRDLPPADNSGSISSMLRDVGRCAVPPRIESVVCTASRHSNGNDLIPIYPPSTIID